MEILKNKEDIREFPIYRSFIYWELNNKKLHRDNENLKRNLDIFIIYMGKAQRIEKVSMREIGEKYNLKKERVRQIFTKYLLYFILYMFYIGNLDYNPNDNNVFTDSIELLPNRDKERVIQHFKDKKPFKYIGPQDLRLIKRTCKIL